MTNDLFLRLYEINPHINKIAMIGGAGYNGSDNVDVDDIFTRLVLFQVAIAVVIQTTIDNFALKEARINYSAIKKQPLVQCIVLLKTKALSATII